MSLNSELLGIAEDQITHDFYGDMDVKHTFLHKELYADVVITLNEDGTLHAVNVADRMKVLAPVNLEYLSRSNGHYFPALLHEQLRYLSPDRRHDPKGDHDCNVFYDKYVRQLKGRYEKTENGRLLPILTYVSGGSIEDDLNRAGIEYGEKTVIAFNILIGDLLYNPWKDEELIDEHIRVELEDMRQEGKYPLCYLTGKHLRPSFIFPKGFYGFGGNTHYLSALDDTGTTYHGIHHTAHEAACISRYGNYCIYWALNYILRFHSQMYGTARYAVIATKNELSIKLNDDIRKIMDGHVSDIGNISLKEVIDYRDAQMSRLSKDSNVMFLSIGQMSTGKLSIKHYQTFKGRDARDVIKNYYDWHIDASFITERTKSIPALHYRNGKALPGMAVERSFTIRSPILKLDELISCVNHVKSSNGIPAFINISGKPEKGNAADTETADILIGNILMRRDIPDHMIVKAIRKMEMDGECLMYKYERLWMLHVVCALIRVSKRSSLPVVMTPKASRRYYHGRYLGFADALMIILRKTDKTHDLKKLVNGLANYDETMKQTEKMIEQSGHLDEKILERIINIETDLRVMLIRSRKESKYENILGYEFEYDRRKCQVRYEKAGPKKEAQMSLEEDKY